MTLFDGDRPKLFTDLRDRGRSWTATLSAIEVEGEGEDYLVSEPSIRTRPSHSVKQPAYCQSLGTSAQGGHYWPQTATNLAAQIVGGGRWIIPFGIGGYGRISTPHGALRRDQAAHKLREQEAPEAPNRHAPTNLYLP